ncbi:TPA: DUF3265 domain-containing protein [Vibrio parahaemolyticus]|nr:DUF3265 domain-containing protein [Vibrio parahaemolyticus]
MAFLVCVDFGVEVPCGGLVIACWALYCPDKFGYFELENDKKVQRK